MNGVTLTATGGNLAQLSTDTYARLTEFFGDTPYEVTSVRVSEGDRIEVRNGEGVVASYVDGYTATIEATWGVW